MNGDMRKIRVELKNGASIYGLWLEVKDNVVTVREPLDAAPAYAHCIAHSFPLKEVRRIEVEDIL